MVIDKKGIRKYYNDIFQYCIYKLYNNNYDINLNVEWYFYVLLNASLISKYTNNKICGGVLLLKPHIDNLNNKIYDGSVNFGFKAEYINEYNFQTIEVIEKEIYLVKYQSSVDEYNSMFIKNSEPKKHKISRETLFEIRQYLYLFYQNFENKFRIYKNWRKINLNYQTFKNDGKLNEFIVKFLVSRCKPYSSWNYSVEYMLNRHLSKSEMERFIMSFYNGFIEDKFISILKAELVKAYKSNNGEWFEDSEYYWRLIDIYKDTIERYYIPQPHLGLE